MGKYNTKRNQKIEDEKDERSIDGADRASTRRDRNGKGRGSKPNNSRRGGSGRNSNSIYTGHNDVSWYCKDKSLLDVVTKIPWSYAVGSNSSLSGRNTVNPGGKQFDIYPAMNSFPGIMTIDYYPRWSKSIDGTCALSLAMRNNYAIVRAANSGAKNYDPADLFMYTGAVDSIYSFYAMCVRLMSILDLYNVENAYAPREIVGALGFDFDDFIEKRNKFLSWLQNLPAKVGIYTVPGNMDIVKRHWFLCSELYADSPNPKAAIYAFCPVGFFKYNADTIPAKLEFKQFRTYDVHGKPQVKTVDQTIAYGDDLLQAMWLVSDAMTMAGDIRKAWAPKDWITIPALSSTFKAALRYDESVLMQIEHSIALGSPNSSSLDITQSTGLNEGWLIDNVTYPKNHEPAFFATAFNKMLLNTRKAQATEDDVMYMTRLMAIPTYDPNTEEWALTSYGSEIVRDYHIFYHLYNVVTSTCSLEHMLLRSYYGFRLSTTEDEDPTVPMMNYISDIARTATLAQFDYHPIVYPVCSNEVDGQDHGRLYTLGVNVNLDNFAFISRFLLDQINYVATRTMLDVNGPKV